MRKLCTNCFYQHRKVDCKNEKVKWIDYVKWFVSKNPEFTSKQYGRWIQILEKEEKQDAIHRDYHQAKQQKHHQETTQAPEEGEHPLTKQPTSQALKPQTAKQSTSKEPTEVGKKGESFGFPEKEQESLPDELPNKVGKHEMESDQTLVEPTLEDFKLPSNENDIDRQSPVKSPDIKT